MFKKIGWKTAIALMFLMVGYPQLVASDGFKASDFLEWSRENQAHYIETSIGMAGLVASQNDKAHANCMEDWFYSDEDAKVTFVLETMRRVPDYHPRGVILAVLEKQCGSFNYRKVTN